jgi:hypothetical protein
LTPETKDRIADQIEHALWLANRIERLRQLAQSLHEAGEFERIRQARCQRIEAAERAGLRDQEALWT